jgi:hypothetical protein
MKTSPFLARGVLLSGASLLVAAAALTAQPTNNPITTFYPSDTELAWTDEIAWATVYDVTTDTTLSPNTVTPDDGVRDIDDSIISGDDLADVQAKITALSALGGGVLYFPAGTYDFSDDLIIKDRVVLRGATPGDGLVTQDPDPEVIVDDADNGKSTSYALTTKFVFMKYIPAFTDDGTPNNTAFKKITIDLPRAAAPSDWRFHAPLTSDWTDRNFGLVNIDVNRARIQLMPYTWKWGITQAQKPFIKARNIVVFGCRVNNAAMPDTDIGVTDADGNNGSSNRWLRWPARQVGVIEVFTYRNLLIANNRLNDKAYFQWGTGEVDDFWAYGPLNLRNSGQTLDATKWVGFYYTQTYGIKVNRSTEFPFSQTETGCTPMSEPCLFRQGIAILDNWIFNTSRPAIHAGGDELRMVGNYAENIAPPPSHVGVLPSDSNGRKLMWCNPAATKLVVGADTFENRLADLTGFGIQANRNYGNPFSMRAGATGYTTTDGEGILHQEAGGGSPMIDWTLNQNTLVGGKAYIAIFKSRDIDGVTIIGNNIPNSWSGIWTSIYVEADTNNAPFSVRGVLIEDNFVGGISLSGQKGGENCAVNNNSISSSLLVGDFVTYSGNSIAPTTIETSSGYDPLPDISWEGTYAPTLSIGSNVTLKWSVSDRETAAGAASDPALVEVYRDGVKLGDATKVGGFYEYAYTTTDEDGVYGIYARATEATGAEREWFSTSLPWGSISGVDVEVSGVSLTGTILSCTVSHTAGATIGIEGNLTLDSGGWGAFTTGVTLNPLTAESTEIQIDLTATSYKFFRATAN